jgi:putative colanic acid biosynthesis acetyltransferase WcaF
VTRPRERALSSFTGSGYDKGRGIGAQAAWLFVRGLVFTRWWCPNLLRVAILRAFGATIAHGVLIRHDVRIHWPWKLTIGADSWIGERAWILNLEPVVIGANVCVSQEALLCTGSHDHRSPSFEFDNAPIEIGDGAWIALRATVLRGVTIGRGAVVGANALVVDDVAPDSVVMAPRGVTRA